MESELRQLDPDLLDSDEEQDLLERAAELGIFAIEPISEPRWTVPVDALDDGGEAGPPMGVQATIQQVAISELELEVAVRSLAISTEPSPNDNPGLLGLTVDGKALDDGASLMLEAGESYELLPRLLEGSLESYTVLDAEGLPIESVEEPYLSWYAQEGSFGATVTTAEDEPTTWTAPDDAHEGVLICVVRDGRGGMDWTTLQVEVE